MKCYWITFAHVENLEKKSSKIPLKFNCLLTKIKNDAEMTIGFLSSCSKLQSELIIIQLGNLFTFCIVFHEKYSFTFNECFHYK